MIGCAVSADLARYEAEYDRACALDDHVSDIVREHAEDVAERLLQCRKWVSEQFSMGEDEMLNDIEQAVMLAAAGDEIAAGRTLVRTFRAAAREAAGEILEAATIKAVELDRSPPTAESVDLGEWE
jgi:hypothetical protein